MTIQHVLLSRDGENKIVEKAELENELVTEAPEHLSAGEDADKSSGHCVPVKKHYCKGKYYAVALDRHAASNEIDDIIDLLNPSPID